MAVPTRRRDRNSSGGKQERRLAPGEKELRGARAAGHDKGKELRLVGRPRPVSYTNSLRQTATVGPDRYQEALAQPHVRPMDFTGRPLAGMVYVDPAGYRSDRALATWIRRGVDFVSTAPAKKHARPRKLRPRSSKR